jgi:hypothetical protein
MMLFEESGELFASSNTPNRKTAAGLLNPLN